MEDHTTQEQSIPQANYLMETKDLSFHYDRQFGISHVDLKIPAGEVFGFLGRNGAGKTTTLNILSGVFHPHAGKIHFAGREGSKVQTDWKHDIGYVPQEPNFLRGLSPADHSVFLGSVYKTWDADLCGRILSDFELPMKKAVNSFSTGMKTKLAFALAVSHRPKLVILDEPTAGLDPIARRQVLQMIEELRAAGTTVVFSTHIVADLTGLCTHIGIIDAGRLIYLGLAENLGEPEETMEEAYFRLLKRGL